MQDLERRALVRRVRGQGTFRSRRIDYVVSRRASPSWSRTVRAAGAVPRTVVRSCDELPAPVDVAGRLAEVLAQVVAAAVLCSTAKQLGRPVEPN